MDQLKIGALIRRNRLHRGLTQRQLAQRLQVSDQAVSKWERGLGAPDVSLLSQLSEVLEVNLEALLAGTQPSNPAVSGNMKKARLFVCPECGNLLWSLEEAQMSCCGRKLSALMPQKEDGDHALRLEAVEQEWFLTTDHPMSREHHIGFVAFLDAQTLILRKRYAEWGLDTRLPRLGHGTLFWYCSRHGLFYRNL